nr:glycine-rich cell wall structural protein-like [Coffea arabica]
MNPIAMITPPFMPPPFLDIVIAVIFEVGVVDLTVGFSRAIAGKIELVGALAWAVLFSKVGRKVGIRDMVTGEGDTTESGGRFNKDGAWEEVGSGGGVNAGEGGIVSGHFIAEGGGETEVGGDRTAIGREGKGERAGERGVVSKEGEGDACGGGGGDKFTDEGGAAGGGGGDSFLLGGKVKRGTLLSTENEICFPILPLKIYSRERGVLFLVREMSKYEH